MDLKAPPLEFLIENWNSDANINATDPSTEIIRIPILHSKYNKFLTLHKLAEKKARFEYDKMKKIKWSYYTGKLTEEELKQHNWEPFQFVLKSDISVYIDGDDDLSRLKRKIAYHEEAAKFCEYVMKELQSRTYQIRAYMDWEKFVQGS